MFFFLNLITCLKIFILITNLEAFTIKELKSIFQSELCLEGNINIISLKNKKHNNNNNAKIEAILNLTSLGDPEPNEKPVLSKLNELISYNHIDHYFKLEQEEGPAHNKLFTIKLTLGKETYIGQGKSHKKAKVDAALKAFEKTEYELPQIKNKEVDNIEELTPTVLLNNIASKLGIGVTYFLLDKDKEEILHSNLILTEKSKDYIKKLNSSIYTQKNLRMKKDIDSTKGPFRLKLKFGEHTFFATSHSIQSGRHEVASMALDFLVKNKDNLDFACLKDGSENECKKNKEELKSPISKVYEEAQKRKLDVEFNLIEETGPSHKKIFTNECRLGSFVTKGEGKSKKESKKNAAIHMLEKIAEMDPLPSQVEAKHLVKNENKKNKKNKKNKLIKTKLDEVERVLNKVSTSVIGIAKTFFGNEEDKRKTDNLVDNVDNKKNTNKQSRDKSNSNTKSFNEELLQLGKILNIKLSFTDYTEDDQHISLLSLYTNPEFTCFGESISSADARNIAAGNGLNLLNKMGVYDLLVEETGNSLERKTKEEVNTIMGQMISKDKKEEL